MLLFQLFFWQLEISNVHVKLIRTERRRSPNCLIQETLPNIVLFNNTPQERKEEALAQHNKFEPGAGVAKVLVHIVCLVVHSLMLLPCKGWRVADNQLCLQSLAPSSAAGCGQLQLGVGLFR